MINQQTKMLIVDFSTQIFTITSLSTFFVCVKGVMVKGGQLLGENKTVERKLLHRVLDT